MSNECFNEDKKERLKAIKESLSHIIKSTEEMPSHAMLSHITHYDYVSVLVFIESILKCLVSEENVEK